jgi:hypothetical protein
VGAQEEVVVGAQEEGVVGVRKEEVVIVQGQNLLEETVVFVLMVVVVWVGLQLLVVHLTVVF